MVNNTPYLQKFQLKNIIGLFKKKLKPSKPKIKIF